MHVITALQVDLDVSPIGTRSRLADDLVGRPVLRRTIDRLSSVARASKIIVLCPAGQRDRCQEIVSGSEATILAIDATRPVWADVVRASRKWSLEGWRGGIGGATCFDEFVDCRVLATLLESEPADAVLCVSAAAPVVDPKLCDDIIAQKEHAGEDIRLTFSQALPGLAGIVLDAGLIRELAARQLPVGWLFAYQPEAPKKDLLFLPTCCELAREVRHARGRLIVDTDRSFELVGELIRELDALDARSIGCWMTRREQATAEPFPREIEIELTTDDPYPDAVLRPRGKRVPPREPMSLAVVERLADQLHAWDDTLVVLGGFGDPFRHAQFAKILQALRPNEPGKKSVFGLAVRTTGVDLTDEHIRLLIDHRVDIVNVVLDAWTPDLYGRLQSPGDPAAVSLAFVREQIDRLVEKRQERGSVCPLVVPEITKAAQNVGELDDFYDGWIRRLGAANIMGYSHRARQCPEHAVMSMAPATRTACQRLRQRCVILSNGLFVPCDQDFRGDHAIGNVSVQSIAELWQAERLTKLRQAHRDGRYSYIPICPACDEWHRP